MSQRLLAVVLLALFACTPGRAPTPIPSEGPRSFFSANGRLAQAGTDIDRAGFSPNGKHLALAASTPDGYRLALARAGRVMVVPIDPPVEIADFAWMPDSESLLVAYHAPFDDELAPYFDSLAIVNLQGRIMRKISPTKKLRMDRSGISVTPDGKRAFLAASPEGQGSANGDMYELDLETGVMQQLTRTPESEDSPKLVTSDRLIFVLVEGSNRSALAAFDLKTRQVTRLSPPDHVVGTPSALFGGSRILYDAYPAGGVREQRQIWAIAVQGGAPEIVVQLDAVDPAFHPDGRHAVVHVVEGFGGGYLKLVTLPS